MVKGTFRWSSDGSLPIIASHSDAKLNLLARYLDKYFTVVGANPRMEKLHISFVDGFSGGGMYSTAHGDERPGSPLVILEAIRSALDRLNRDKRKELHISYKCYFVDANKKAISFLNKTLVEKGFGDQLGRGEVQLIHGKFENSYTRIVKDIKSRQRVGRSIFILDQKGWNAVQFQAINNILTELPKSEVILTFAVDWLISYLNGQEAFQKASRRLGIHEDRLKEYLRAKEQEGYRFLIPRMLIDDISKATGAPFYTPFFLRSREAMRDLWIIHLSKIVTARNVMIEGHWNVGNSSLHQGPAGLNMLGFDPHWDERVAFDFGFDEAAGEEVTGSLLSGLPNRIEILGGAEGTAVGTLMQKIANETAATSDQIKDAISLLHQHSAVELFTSEGGRRRLASVPNPTDRVSLSRQLIIPLSISKSKR